MSAAFQAKEDIGNRALQHCGASRMDPTLGFNEGSVNAAEVASCYDKLREAELQANLWTFATKRVILRAIDTSAMLLQPTLWSSTVTYFHGSIVSDATGNYWESRIPNNLNNDPLLTSYWEPYFGPLSVPIYDTTGFTAYNTGELVYTTPGDGTYRVYRSLISGNSDVPGTATAWSSSSTYYKNQVATFNSVAYMSLIDLNINNEPDLAPALWSSVTTYTTGQKVGGSDGTIYQSIGNGNLNHNPVLDLTHTFWTNTGVLNPWTTVFTGGIGSLNWLEIGGAEFPSGVGLSALNIIYPVGAGPASQIATNNVFMLPNSFLRQAPTDPKTGVRLLGGPSGIDYNDWVFENNLLVSRETGPLLLRFVANITDVRIMHSMFCEGLAARIGFEVCEKVTQSTAKKQTISRTYKEWVGEAKIVNAIETGYFDQPDDDFVSVRA